MSLAIYKIEWESVDDRGKGRRCYNNDIEPLPFVEYDKVPEECWEKREEISESPWFRVRCLRLWEAQKSQYVRRVKVFQMHNQPEWKELTTV